MGATCDVELSRKCEVEQVAHAMLSKTIYSHVLLDFVKNLLQVPGLKEICNDTMIVGG